MVLTVSSALFPVTRRCCHRHRGLLLRLSASLGAASARFPKFARHRSDFCRELRKAKGTRDSEFSSAAFDLKFLWQIRGNFRRNFKSAALGPHVFVVRRSAPLVGIAISVHRTPFHVRDDAYVPLAGTGWATQ
jgi:hypothetical protein